MFLILDLMLIPTLFDVDNDNDLDLVVGEAIGNLNYIENIGDSINLILI
jgi:hypothetical protein